MSQAPLRISSNRAGSNPYSDTGLPTTALNPTLGSAWPSYSHVCRAIFGVNNLWDTIGELFRHAAGEGVRGFDDVVVDGDDGVAALGPLRLGQERDGSVLTGLGGGEVEICRRARRWTSRITASLPDGSSSYASTPLSALMVIRAAPAQYTSAARSISDACIPNMSPYPWCDGFRLVSITSYASLHTRSIDAAR